MKLEIRIPEVGESVKEAVLAEWFKKDGDTVKKDEPLFVIETDKVTLEIPAEADGVLSITVPEGETVGIGAVVGAIETETVSGAGSGKEEKEAEFVEKPPAKTETKAQPLEKETEFSLPPSVRRLVAEKGVNLSEVQGTGPGGRITKGDVLLYLERSEPETAPSMPSKSVAPQTPPSKLSEKPSPPPSHISPKAPAGEEKVTRKPLSPIRRRIAERLLEAKQNTAMLTTFNEIDMSRLQSLRARYKDAFKEKHGVGLGMMSFFIKAVVEALGEFPAINAFILDGKEIEYHDYCHIGVAIGAERGLVVPVIRHAERLSFAEIEQAIINYVKKIKENRLELADLEGGTFTISNGGVYGSLLSTPILNVPQSGILGMHKVEDRPVVIDGEIRIRPMMYVALSYDHRIVDGKDAVTFLKRIKEYVEEPERMMLEV